MSFFFKRTEGNVTAAFVISCMTLMSEIVYLFIFDNSVHWVCTGKEITISFENTQNTAHFECTSYYCNEFEVEYKKLIKTAEVLINYKTQTAKAKKQTSPLTRNKV